MRMLGRDGFVLSPDVVARLTAEGVIDKAPTSKRALAQTQEAFNLWSDQSGRGLTQISQVLAFSV
ncbi:MAG: 3-methyladenine DNA glycosylase, partial [Pseudomonadota bacterium]